MAMASFPLSSSPARSKRLPVKRPASSRTRTATAPMSVTATCASSLVGGECRRVDSFCELLFYEIEVLHEGNGRENRCADADFGDVLFDLVLAVEVRNARLSVSGADVREDEMHAYCLGRIGDSNTLPCLGVRASGRHCHREERCRPFERLFNRSTVIERRRNDCRPAVRERLCAA